MTNNIVFRLKEHFDNRGTTLSFTGKYYCYNLIYFECHQYVNEAIEREKTIKKLRRESKMELILSMNPAMAFLNKQICGEWPPTYAGRS